MHPESLLAFMHIYKCGGTTFNWALRRAFQERILYCENSSQDSSHIEKSQYDSYLKKVDSHYTAISSHLIRYSALADFDIVVTILRDPAKRLLSAFNFDIATGGYIGDIDSYIEQRVNAMTWTLGDRFLAEIDSGRIFCCILEHFDLSMVSLEHLLAINGHEIDLAVPKALNTGKERLKGRENILTGFTDEQLARIRSLNQSDYELYSSQLSKFKGFCMAIPLLEQKLNEHQIRKEKATVSIPLIKSFGQGPRHFTLI